MFSGHFTAVGMARIATVDGLVLDIELEEIDVTQDFLEGLRGGFWDRRPEVKVKGRLVASYTRGQEPELSSPALGDGAEVLDGEILEEAGG